MTCLNKRQHPFQERHKSIRTSSLLERIWSKPDEYNPSIHMSGQACGFAALVRAVLAVLPVLHQHGVHPPADGAANPYVWTGTAENPLAHLFVSCAMKGSIKMSNIFMRFGQAKALYKLPTLKAKHDTQYIS